MSPGDVVLYEVFSDGLFACGHFDEPLPADDGGATAVAG